MICAVTVVTEALQIALPAIFYMLLLLATQSYNGILISPRELKIGFGKSGSMRNQGIKMQCSTEGREILLVKLLQGGKENKASRN